HVRTLFVYASRRRDTRFSRDWSSDVCSSDLPASTHVAPHLSPNRGADAVAVEKEKRRALWVAYLTRARDAGSVAVRPRRRGCCEIGRAACRGRVGSAWGGTQRAAEMLKQADR